MTLFKTLPTHINDFLPSLMVEVCLVLAPDVNFFLKSHKQGLPCYVTLEKTTVVFSFSFLGFRCKPVWLQQSCPRLAGQLYNI